MKEKESKEERKTGRIKGDKEKEKESKRKKVREM